MDLSQTKKEKEKTKKPQQCSFVDAHCWIAVFIKLIVLCFSKYWKLNNKTKSLISVY